MKKFYLFSSVVLLAMSSIAQDIQKLGVTPVTATYVGSASVPHSSERAITCPDTAALVNYQDFLPEFLPSGSAGLYIISYGTPGVGYLYGNNGGQWNIFAQGYANTNGTAVKVQGAIVWVRYKQRDLAGGSSSKIQIGAFAVAPNNGYNDISGSFNSTTINWVGPVGTTPVTTADLLFNNIDTVPKNYAIRGNYVAFASPPTFTGDFAISVNSRATMLGSGAANLTAGDTIGILTDAQNDAANLDYLWHMQNSGKWLVSDQLFTLGSTGVNHTTAVFPVLCDATGVNEYFNGMKLAAYPNPANDHTTIEYTLEKNSTNVSLTVSDLLGKEISLKEAGAQSAGTYKVNLETADLPAGNYFYQLRSNGNNFTKKITVSH